MNAHQAAIDRLTHEIKKTQVNLMATGKQVQGMEGSMDAYKRSMEDDQVFISQCRKSIRVLQEVKDGPCGDAACDDQRQAEACENASEDTGGNTGSSGGVEASQKNGRGKSGHGKGQRHGNHRA